MKAWQVDQMVEDDRNHKWEELNAPDQYDDALKAASNYLGTATVFIDAAEIKLYDAESELSGTPMADKVQSLIDQLMDLHLEIFQLSEAYAKGRRE